MRYALMREMDISNGPGIRASLFVQGCHFHCKGCFNKETWDFKGGIKWDKLAEDQFVEICKNPNITGISILGGEPLDQDKDLLKLLKRLNKEIPNKDIWMWTGYEIDKIPYTEILKWNIIKEVDTIVDGQFIEENHEYDLQFFGSTNQRILSKILIDQMIRINEVIDERKGE